MTKLDDALDVLFIAVDRYFEPDATPDHGVALQAAMNRVTSLRAGASGHTVCVRQVCGCKLKLRSRKLLRDETPSTTHIRRRECHPELRA